MTINRTTLLDLPLPVTGTEPNTWGDVVNYGLTEYLDISIAGSLDLSTDADVLLASTEGTAIADNIGATTAQYAVLRCTGSRTVTRNITAPAWAISSGTLTDYSKTYIVVNETTGGQNIVLRATNSVTPTYTTGVTIVPGERAVCVWNGSDFVKAGGVIGGSNTQVQYNNAGVLGGIANATSDGTTLSMTSPKVITGINDTNGNELLKVTATGSAVNELTLANAATGNAPTLSATGDDTNIGINITPKGSGVVTISNLAVTTIDATNIEVTNIKAKDGTAAASIADSTGVISVTANPILSGGTANGVLYLNGSKVATSGSALTFDGTTFSNTGSGDRAKFGTGSRNLYIAGDSTGVSLFDGASQTGNGWYINTASSYVAGYIGSSEQMRLTSTGLGIGTSSPGAKLQVAGGIYASGGNNFFADASGGFWASGNNVYAVGWFESSGSMIFRTATTERMRLDSSGNLGIGTSSPAYKLDVSGYIRGLVNTSSVGNASSMQLTQNGTGDAAVSFLIGSTTEWLLGVDNSASDAFKISNITGGSDFTSTGIVLDTSGNLGLGVTPSAWDTVTAFQAKNASFGGYANNAYLAANWYYASGDKYIASDYATQYQQSAGKHMWFTAPSGTAGNAITFTQAMTLDASGNLGVGETSPDTRAHIYGANTAGRGQLYIQSSGTVSRFVMANSSDAQALNTYGDSSTSLVTWDAGSGYSFRWTVADTERARITSGGSLLIGSTSNNGKLYVEQSSEVNTAKFWDTNGTTTSDGVLAVLASRNTTNNTFYAISYYNSGASAYKFRVADSGDVTNTNGTYGTISDAKMKTDIVDAGSQWADIKAIRFRKFKMKDNPSGLLQLGVVAQELEQTSPGLVDEHVDRDADGNDLGTTTKSVKTSILLMKAAKALQEAMARIETLEAKVSALEGN